jgi:tetratricopeptide (TPR) repeat protein
MGRMRRKSYASILLILFLATPALADDIGEARAHYQKGGKLYDLGKYLDAAKEYEAAYQIKDDPVLLFNIGQAYRLARSYPDAIRAYRSYLRRRPDAPNRAEVENRIREMQELVEKQSSNAEKPPAGPMAPAETAPAAGATPAPTNTTTQVPPPREEKPLYKKWWLWTAVGGVVVVAVVVGVTVGVLESQDSFNASLGKFGPGALKVSF